MGGRLDATNVLDLGVAAITNVQRDHEAYLGNTLAAIGGEKAAIIKPGNLAVTGASGRGLRPILDRCAAARACRFAVPDRASRTAPTLRHLDWDGIVVDARTPSGELADLRVGLLGAHQAENAAVALALLDALAERHGIAVDESEHAPRPGRRRAGPGASSCSTGHASASVGCCSTARTTRPGRRRWRGRCATSGLRRPTIVFGAMRAKKVHAVLRALAPLEPRFIFTRVDDPGAHDPADLARIWRRGGGRRRRYGAHPGRGAATRRRRSGGGGRLALPRRRGSGHDHRHRRGGVMGPELRWGERTYLMGIINVTPDSFSGDGLATPDRAPDEIVAVALALGTRHGLGRRRDPGRRGRVDPAAPGLRRPSGGRRRHRDEPRRTGRPRPGGRARRSGTDQHRHEQGRGGGRGRRGRRDHRQRRVGRAARSRHRRCGGRIGRAPGPDAQPGRRRLSGRGLPRPWSIGCARRSRPRRRAAWRATG